MDLSPVTLEGEHVRLEPLAVEHVDALTAIGCDAELWRWIPVEIGSRAEMLEYVEKALAR